MSGALQSLDLPALLRRAWARRMLLLKFYAAVVVLGLGVVLLLPRWYVSSVTLVPAPKDGLTLDLSGAGAALGGTSLSFGAGPTPQDQLKMVVASRAVADSVITRFDLVRAWHLKRRDQAREQLADHVTITTPKEGQVVVAVEAERPALARDMAAWFSTYSAQEAVRLKTSLATQRRTYLQARLPHLDHDITLASAPARALQEGQRP